MPKTSKTATNRRELLMLAHKLDAKSKIAGWYASTKLDGTRCFWDGGITRAMRTKDVPWASLLHPKTGETKKDIKPYSTGLWSRYGNPIIAPNWFLDRLPNTPIDGELWAGNGKFQLLRSIVAGNAPDSRWYLVEFVAFGAPPIDAFLQPGEIKNANQHTTICKASLSFHNVQTLGNGTSFRDELDWLDLLKHNPSFRVLRQYKLNEDESVARTQLDVLLDQVVASGGEGMVVRDPASLWTPKRSKSLLKYKPYTDDEATLVGFTAGRETNKGSRLLGKIGALIVDYKGRRLELSGLTDEEREFATTEDQLFAAGHPGQDVVTCFASRHFQLGQTVTFRYRELTDDGIPREAVYHRTRSEE